MLLGLTKRLRVLSMSRFGDRGAVKHCKGGWTFISFAFVSNSEVDKGLITEWLQQRTPPSTSAPRFQRLGFICRSCSGLFGPVATCVGSPCFAHWSKPPAHYGAACLQPQHLFHHCMLTEEQTPAQPPFCFTLQAFLLGRSKGGNVCSVHWVPYLPGICFWLFPVRKALCRELVPCQVLNPPPPSWAPPSSPQSGDLSFRSRRTQAQEDTAHPHHDPPKPTRHPLPGSGC